MTVSDPHRPSPLLTAATSAGFDVVHGADLPVDPAAVRMLPRSAVGVAVALAGSVLRVVCDHVPSGAAFAALERASGMPVTVVVADPPVYNQIRARALDGDGGVSPWSLAALLPAVAAAGAAGVHLSVGSVPLMRTGGELRAVDGWPVLSREDLLEAAAFVIGDRAPQADMDATFTYASTRWRAHLSAVAGTPALTLRSVPVAVPRLEELGLPASVAELVAVTHGLVLFTGPARSGKTSSVAAFADRVASTRRVHVVSVEQPVERRLPNRVSLVEQREVGVDVESFADGIAAAVAADADVVVVSDLSDPGALLQALAAAESGHLVVAAVPATGVVAALGRLLAGVDPTVRAQVAARLAGVLRAVFGQVLLPAPDGRMQLACEVLAVGPAVQAVVREDRLVELPATMEVAGGTSVTLERSLAALASSGRVAVETARAAAVNAARFEAALSRSGAAAAPSAAAPVPPPPPAAAAGAPALGGRRAQREAARTAGPASTPSASQAGTAVPPMPGADVSAAAPKLPGVR